MLAPIDQLRLRLEDSQRARLRGQLATDTIAMLREAVAAGFTDVNRVRDEPLFTPIRGDAAYRAVLVTIELPRDVFARP